MNPEKKLALQEHLDAIAELLYEETEPDDLNDLEKIEIVVRDRILSHVSPSLCFFLLKKQQGQRILKKNNEKSLIKNPDK